MYRNNPLRNVSWSAFQGLGLAEKGVHFLRDGSPYHALIAQQFSRSMLDRLCELTTKIRHIAKTKEGMIFLQGLLSEKRAMLYFVQPSTRTFLSFSAACQIVGMRTEEVRDTSTSSELKGENPEDTVRTFSSYFDIIIMRHPVGGFAERIAWMLSNTDRPVPVVNAGSGKDQHPTQALLDVYTLQRSFEGIGGIEGKKIAFVGDLARGRTVRSLAWLLTHYPGVKQYFVAPEQLQIGGDVLASLTSVNMDYEVTHDFEGVLPDVDAVYMTRIQDEWDQPGESSPVDTEGYHLTAAHLEILRSTSVILHPLPRRKEIAAEIDSDPRAMYWRQVRNGMWVRAALMLTIFERVADVEKYYEDLPD